jgi:predicted HTH domain antitoxin
MSLLISDEVIQQIHLSENDLQIEIAVMLYQSKKFTLGQASKFAGITQLGFQKILSNRNIPIHFDMQQLQYDVETLNTLFHE